MLNLFHFFKLFINLIRAQKFVRHLRNSHFDFRMAPIFFILNFLFSLGSLSVGYLSTSLFTMRINSPSNFCTQILEFFSDCEELRAIFMVKSTIGYN